MRPNFRGAAWQLIEIFAQIGFCELFWYLVTKLLGCYSTKISAAPKRSLEFVGGTGHGARAAENLLTLVLKVIEIYVMSKL